jgi:hypothetical protein
VDFGETVRCDVRKKKNYLKRGFFLGFSESSQAVKKNTCLSKLNHFKVKVHSTANNQQKKPFQDFPASSPTSLICLFVWIIFKIN